MHLIKKSRRMLSGIFHARPDSDPSTSRSRSKGSSRSRRSRSKRRTSSLSVTRRTMDIFIYRGEKRKREDVDDGHDDVEWDFVQCKKRLVEGRISPLVAEEDIEREQVLHKVEHDSLRFYRQASDVEPGELPDDYEELLERVHSNLENLTITDTDNSLPGSMTSTRQTSLDPHTDLDWAWLEGLHNWENRYRARRCHSETSTRILSHANAVTGQLPDGSGRRSAPPNLDTAWGLSSGLNRRASLGSVSALSEDGTLDGMLEESALELVLFADSEAGEHVEVGREGDVEPYVEEEDDDEATQVGTEVEDADSRAAMGDVNSEAAVAAVVEDIREATAWQGVEATAWEAYEPTLEESRVKGESAENPGAESRYSSEPVSERGQEPGPTQMAECSSRSASPPAEPISELTFRRQYDSLLNWGFDAPEVELEPRLCRRPVTAEDMASRIRAVKNKMLENLLDIEHRLRPHCSGTHF
ncbi:hypothetical protein TgHK011_008922 [Trichoderma gracile]|nr:hypothetical protein TgHK011_008922 [Trichoderma gracile]